MKVPALRSASAMTWCHWPSLTALWLARLALAPAACAVRVTPPASLTRRAYPAASIFWISVASFCPGAVLKYASIRKFEVWICGLLRSAPLTIRSSATSGPPRVTVAVWPSASPTGTPTVAMSVLSGEVARGRKEGRHDEPSRSGLSTRHVREGVGARAPGRPWPARPRCWCRRTRRPSCASADRRRASGRP